MRWDDAATSTLDPDLSGQDPPDMAGAPTLALGRGAGGTVVQGRDRHLPRMVAWKVARGEHARARLQHEARVLAALEHPSIVAIHDLVDDPDGSLRIALRLVRGETLHTRIRQAADLPARLRLVRPFMQMVEAVAWAHRLGWLHRDLKPANLMIGEFGETQVIDWGLAINLDESVPAGEVVGTVPTMAPEQARGEVIDASADVWGLGATLFELVAGRPMHVEGDLRALLPTVRSGARPSIDVVCPEAPAELRAIIERCLAPRPEDRYPDAQALAVDLAAHLDGRRVAAHEYTRWELLARVVRAWRLPLGIALAVVVTGAIAGVLAYREIGAERDDAVAARSDALAALAARDEEIAAGGIIEARRELRDRQRPEAELAAARTLAVRESPEARGVVAAFARTPRPVRTRSLALPGCIDVDVAGDAVLCGNRAQLSLVAGRTTRWTYAAPYRDVAFIDDARRVLVVAPDRGYVVLDANDGRVTAADPSYDCLGRVHRDPRARQALGLGHACAELIGAGGRTALPLCEGHIEVAAIDDDGRVAALCMGGELVVRAADGAITRRATGIGALADTLLSATLIGDRLVVGSSRGVLEAIDLATGASVVRRVLEPAAAIVALSSSDDRLVVQSEGQGALVLIAATLTPVGRLPRVDVDFVRFVGADLVTYDAAGALLSWWRTGAREPASFDGLGGITSLRAQGDGLLVTHDSSALVIAPDGSHVAEATWVEVIAKAAVIVGDEVHVAIAGRQTGEVLAAVTSTPDGPSFVEQPALRRVATLSDARMVGSRTGLGLTYWPRGLDAVRIDEAQIRDLAERDDFAATLSDGPRALTLYDMRHEPIAIGRCLAPAATAIGLGASDPYEPMVLVVTPAAVWSLRASDCTPVATFASPAGELVVAVATRDGRFVAAGTRAGDVHVWRGDGALVASAALQQGAVTTLSLDLAEAFLWSGAWDGRANSLDLATLDVPRADLVRAIVGAWRP